MIDIQNLDDKKLCSLIDNRWNSSQTIWETIQSVYQQNTLIYENKAEWIKNIPKKKVKTQANRIFVNMEAVINVLIANPAKINFIPTRTTPEAQELAKNEELFFQKKFRNINFKETMRMALRNLFFARLLCIKAFWDSKKNDFDFKSIDPRKVRIGKYAKNEEESEFAIEEVPDTLSAICARFPEKKKDILDRTGYSEEDIYMRVKIKNLWKRY